MPPPGYEPFLAAICAAPDDDVPRLVYADWLEENGDADRAEFIRAQVAWAAHPVGRNPAGRRARALLREYGARWRAELPAVPAADWGEFRRGFAAAASVRNAADLPGVFAALFAAAPVEHLKLVHCRPVMLRELARSPVLSRVRRIEAAAGFVDDDALAELAAAPGAAGITEMMLRGEQWATTADGRRVRVPVVTDRGAYALAASPHLTRLGRLWLTGVHVTSAGTAALNARFRARVQPADAVFPW